MIVLIPDQRVGYDLLIFDHCLSIYFDHSVHLEVL